MEEMQPPRMGEASSDTAITLSVAVAAMIAPSTASAAPEVVEEAWLPAGVLCAPNRGHPALPVGRARRAVSDRPGQWLRRQHLADPDDPDRQGFRGAGRHQQAPRRLSGDLDQHGRGSAAGCHRGLHQPGLRRHHHPRGEPRKLRSGDPHGRPQRRRARAPAFSTPVR